MSYVVEIWNMFANKLCFSIEYTCVTSVNSVLRNDVIS